jgi:hypothetical protein
MGHANGWCECARHTSCATERPECLRSSDAVLREPTPRLEVHERPGRLGREPPVDRLRTETERDEPEFERGHVPAERTHAQLALTEEWPSERAEGAAGGRLDRAARKQAGTLLEPDQPGARERPVDAVDGCRILAMRPQGNLEGSDAGAARARGGARDSECHGKRSGQHEEAVHTTSVGKRGARLKQD